MASSMHLGCARGLLAAIVVSGAGSHPALPQPERPREPDRSVGQVAPDPECRDAPGMPFDALPADAPPPHRTTPASLCVSVVSNGCTDRGSFAVAVVSDDTVARVTLTRIRPDPCRMKSHRIWLPLRWQELGFDAPRPVVIELRDPP